MSGVPSACRKVLSGGGRLFAATSPLSLALDYNQWANQEGTL